MAREVQVVEVDGRRLTMTAETFDDPDEFSNVPGALIAALMSATVRAGFALTECRAALTNDPDLVEHAIGYSWLATRTLDEAKEQIYRFVEQRRAEPPMPLERSE
jgi:hypothetical protein